MKKYLLEALQKMERDHIRLNFFGDLSRLPRELQELAARTLETSTHYQGFQANICLNYGGRDEIVRAARKFAKACMDGAAQPDDLTEEQFSGLLFSKGIPDPDLIIRPSGEIRISNFLLWQSAYSEFYFTDVLWPDFTPKHLEEAIASYNKRSRRFGGVKYDRKGRMDHVETCDGCRGRHSVSASGAPLGAGLGTHGSGGGHVRHWRLGAAPRRGETGGRLTGLTVLAAALAPVAEYASLTGLTQNSLLGALWLAFVFLLFVLAICSYGREGAVTFRQLSAALFAALVFPTMLATLLQLRLFPGLGKVLVFVPLCISFGSDTFALFAGMLFGRHKLAPLVSPKKTVEGAVGGLAGGVLGMLLIRWIGLLALDTEICSLLQALILGLVGSVIGQIGDLSYSVVKREFGIKDYGNLLPGHGGILDRFDSVSFVSPFVLHALVLWIAR